MNASHDPLVALPVCTTSEAARQLGVSSTTVQLMVERGELKAWRTRGGHRRISLDSVQSIQRQRGAAPGACGSGAGPVCVLVLEPGGDAEASCAEALRSWGWSLQVMDASDPFEALIIVERRRPDVLIIDLDLRGLDARSLIGVLRAHPEFDAMQIVALGRVPDTQRQALREMAGGLALYSKPVSVEKLQGFIEAHLLQHERPGHGTTAQAERAIRPVGATPEISAPMEVPRLPPSHSADARAQTAPA